MTSITASYSPDDNKLRLYASSRLDSETYARVKAAGFRWAPKQDLFFATWTPGAEDLCLELAGEIDDEDKGLVDRAEERAERFEGYSENRMADAESARAAVSAIADNIPFGQPILCGHHSEKHARRDAARIESGMRKAVKMWETSGYWADRAAGAIKAAKYKERPDVRARRIKTIEADKRKRERNKADAETMLKLWSRPGLTLEQATAIANHDGFSSYRFPIVDYPRVDGASMYEGDMGLWSALDGKIITADQAAALAIPSKRAIIAWSDRWIGHFEHRLAYERAMLGESGGTVADKVGPEKGGACRCWSSPGYGKGWSYIRKVNKVSVTVDDVMAYGGKVYPRTVPFDKLAAVMTAAEVAAARESGALHEVDDKSGFFLFGPKPVEDAPATAAEPVAVEQEEVSVQNVQSPGAVDCLPTMSSIPVRLTPCVNLPIEPGIPPESVAVERREPVAASLGAAATTETAERAGRAAFERGMRYEDNPFGLLRADRRLAWSQGFNAARVQRLTMEPQPASLGAAATPPVLVVESQRLTDRDENADLVAEVSSQPNPNSTPLCQPKPAPHSLGAAAVPPVLVVESYSEPPAPANDPYVAMRESLRAGGVKVTVASQLFPTPRALAERMVEEAGLRPGDRILEPSAGTGRLIDAALASGWSGECIAVEINPALATALLAKYDGAGVFVHHGDFLALEPLAERFDRVVMNPPFNDQADIRHVRHAARFLKPGGRLVAIMSAGVTFRGDRMATEFRELVESRGGTIEPLPPDSFRESGTNVNAVLVVIDVE